MVCGGLANPTPVLFTRLAVIMIVNFALPLCGLRNAPLLAVVYLCTACQLLLVEFLQSVV